MFNLRNPSFNSFKRLSLASGHDDFLNTAVFTVITFKMWWDTGIIIGRCVMYDRPSLTDVS